MKKVLVIGAEAAWHTQDLIRAATSRCHIEVAHFRSIQSAVGDQSPRLNAGDRDCIFVRSMPAGSLEQIVFRMDTLGIWHDQGVRIVNPPRSLEIAIDKYLCLVKLEQAGLPVPPTVACQTFEQAMEAFEQLNRDVVVKPLFGSEGKSLMRIDDLDLAARAFRWLEKTDSIIYLQSYIRHGGSDLRLLVIGEEIVGIRRSNPHDWRTNTSRGAVCQAYFPDKYQRELARNAVDAIGAVVAGVDLVQNERGENFVLEVNAVPGWRAVASAHQIDIAAKILTLGLDEQFAFQHGHSATHQPHSLAVDDRSHDSPAL